MEKTQVFFATSTSNIVQNPNLYLEIQNKIRSLGFKLSRNWIQECLEKLKKNERRLSSLQWKQVYKKLLKSLHDTDIIIIDATEKSIGVGFILSYAVMNKKNTLLLLPSSSYKSFTPGFIDGIYSHFLTKKYIGSKADFSKAITEFLNSFLREELSKRFLLRLNAKEWQKINNIAREQNKSINTVIRELIRS